MNPAVPSPSHSNHGARPQRHTRSRPRHRPAFLGPAPGAAPAAPVGAPAAPTAPADQHADLAFADLGLSAASLEAVTAAGYTKPTPVQQRAIPPALAGRDVIATAATGTGKTAAFALPIIERLVGRRGTRALVLAPTRELVQQITEVIRQFGARRGVRAVEIVGGMGMDLQVRGLREGREVVVATPGRLIDHLDRGTARLDAIEVLVLDEADRMLDMGFKPQMERILSCVPEKRQTLLLSATMGGEVTQFARACLVDPVRVETTPSGTVASRAEQRVFYVRQEGKLPLLQALLRQDDKTTLVFTRTKHRAEKLAKSLDKQGFAVARIHGDRSQSQRNAALEDFRSGGVRILVATDVAARGLDVEEIGHVVCFDLSLVAEDHVHRVGRTARASASGAASSFCSPEELKLLHEIEKFTRTKIPRAPMPEGLPALPEPVAPAAQERPAVRDPRQAPPGHRPASRTDTPRGPAPGSGPRGGSGGGGGRGPRGPWHKRPHGPSGPSGPSRKGWHRPK